MVAAKFVDPLDVACHTQDMSNVRPQNIPEKPQQELRFTAHDLAFDEGLALTERDGEIHRRITLESPLERHPSYLPRSLHLYAMQRIMIDTSDFFEGYSQNYSTFGQYREAIKRLSLGGTKQFKLDPWVKELNSGGPNGVLRGLMFRLRIDPTDVDTIIAPPFLGSSRSLQGVSDTERLQIESANNTLAAARKAAYIPIRYEIARSVEDPTEAVERVRALVALGGVTVSQMVIVPSYPRSARERDIFNNSQVPSRTYQRIDERFADELLPAKS